MDSFDKIIGNNNAKKLLLSALKNNRIAHGYLFIGVEKLGKFLLAKEFVKALSCQRGEHGDPCGVCSKCVSIDNESDPDVLFINSSKKKILDKDGKESKHISVDQIRNLEHHLSLFPYNSKYKVAVINEAHKFTEQAINAFLKTLEEPKGNSVIILIADNSKFLLDTLISRMQVIRFWPLDENAIDKFLIDLGVQPKDAKMISELSFGKPGIAMDYFTNKLRIDEYHRNEDFFWKFFFSALPDRMMFLEELTKKENDLKDTLQFWLLCARKKILENYTSVVSAKKDSFYNEIKQEKILEFMNHITIILNLINNSNINKRLALEILTLEI